MKTQIEIMLEKLLPRKGYALGPRQYGSIINESARTHEPTIANPLLFLRDTESTRTSTRSILTYRVHLNDYTILPDPNTLDEWLKRGNLREGINVGTVRVPIIISNGLLTDDSYGHKQERKRRQILQTVGSHKTLSVPEAELDAFYREYNGKPIDAEVLGQLIEKLL